MEFPKHIIEACAQATQLNRKIKELQTQLETHKEVIRSFALLQELDPEETMIKIPTPEGVTSVIFIRDKAKVKDDKNIEDLKRFLVPSTLEHIVEEQTVLTNTFADTFWNRPKTFSESERAVIYDFVRWEPQKPRVEPAK